jgi:hypothetical protein
MWDRLERAEMRGRTWRSAARAAAPGERPDPSRPPGSDGLPQIEHIVVLMMENHSYDNYLGMLRDRGDGFRLGADGKPDVWNAAAGGEPVQMSDSAAVLSSTWPAISPDGKLIAFRSVDPKTRSAGVVVIPFAGGPPLKVLQLGYTPVRWSPDSKSLTYVQSQGNVDNLWSQPVDGGPPRQITRFDALQIFNFDWSADGQRLALARGLVNTDVIELKDLTR